MSKIKNTNYFTVQGWMINELNLSSNELLIFAVIYGFSQDGCSEFTGSLNYLCDFINSTKPTVIKCLKSLTDKGYLIKTDRPLNGQNFPTYRAYSFDFTGGKVSLPYGQNSLLVDGKETLPPIKETLPNNTINNNTINNDNDKGDPPPQIPKSFKDFKDVDFQEEIKRVKAENPTKYDNKMLNKFYNWWSEKDEKGVMKFQKQKTWETGKRMANWLNNNYN